MKILCPHCGVEGAADDSYTGKEVRCPRCKVIFWVASEGENYLHEDVQILSATLSSSEPEVVNIIESLDEIRDVTDSDYEFTSVSSEKEDADEPVTGNSAEFILEDDFSEKPMDAPRWSDIVNGIGRESRHRDELDRTAVEKPLDVLETEVVEKVEVNLSAGERDKIAADSSIPGADVASTLRARGFQGNDSDLAKSSSARSGFSIMGVIKDAWAETRGAKASVWAGSSIMYFVMFIAAVAGAFLMPALGFDMSTTTGMAINVAVQGLLSMISIVFTAGLLYMGVRKAAGDIISWKMVFTGFSFTGQIILATVLQAILVGLGFLLLVLPGIYLTIGYGLTLPLILDRKMSAWEAMETSRKAIHVVWWKVAGVLFLMGFIYAVSAIPLGIGLIWTVPMFIVLVGVVYRCLFGVGEKLSSYFS